MYSENKSTSTWYEQINWSGVAGLVVMAIGSALGWVAIIGAFRAIVR